MTSPYRPYTRPPKVPPVALVRSDGRIVSEDGSTRGLFGMDPTDPTRVYADRRVGLRLATSRKTGTLVCWDKEAIRWEVGGRSVILLGGNPGDGENVLAGLVAWRDWVRDCGATIASIGGTARSLLRASLRRPLSVAWGEVPPLPEVIGGRRQAGLPGGTAAGPFTTWDIQAAYTRVLGGLCYPPGGWVRIDSQLPAADDPRPAFARVEVTVPRDLRWGPIPRRHRTPPPNPIARRQGRQEYPVGYRVRGVYAVAEVRAAERAGASVKVRDVWVMGARRPTYPFRSWLDLIEDGRRLPGYAGRLAKMTGNALWGTFVYSGERTRLSYETGERVETPDPVIGRGIPAPDLAELVNAQVRARLLDDLLVPYGEHVWSISTDGGIVDAKVTPTLPSDWRVKERGSALFYITPTHYAWLEGERPGLHLKLAGIPPDEQPDVFWGMWQGIDGAPRLPVDPRKMLGRDPRERVAV